MTNPIKNALIGSAFELKEMAVKFLKRDKTGNENNNSSNNNN